MESVEFGTMVRMIPIATRPISRFPLLVENGLFSSIHVFMQVIDRLPTGKWQTELLFSRRDGTTEVLYLGQGTRNGRAGPARD